MKRVRGLRRGLVGLQSLAVLLASPSLAAPPSAASPGGTRHWVVSTSGGQFSAETVRVTVGTSTTWLAVRLLPVGCHSQFCLAGGITWDKSFQHDGAIGVSRTSAPYVIWQSGSTPRGDYDLWSASDGPITLRWQGARLRVGAAGNGFGERTSLSCDPALCPAGHVQTQSFGATRNLRSRGYAEVLGWAWDPQNGAAVQSLDTCAESPAPDGTALHEVVGGCFVTGPGAPDGAPDVASSTVATISSAAVPGAVLSRRWLDPATGPVYLGVRHASVALSAQQDAGAILMWFG
jgi:hypothetical protein